MASTFYVNSDGDENDAIIDGTCKTSLNTCTLRAAIQEANNVPESIILFTGKYTIMACSFPTITADGTVINGYNQWSSGEPGVRLQATSCRFVNPLLTLDNTGKPPTLACLAGFSTSLHTSADQVSE